MIQEVDRLSGLSQSVDQINSCALVKFGGVVNIDETDLEPGCAYYVDSYGPVNPNESKLTTSPCDPRCSNCENRCVGVACDNESIIWKLEDPLCVESKCCCCCYHPQNNLNDR